MSKENLRAKITTQSDFKIRDLHDDGDHDNDNNNDNRKR
jgi:hypothetical protein